MAFHAAGRFKRQITARQSFVTALAVGQGVPAHQWEIRLSVDILDVEYGETVGVMAFGAFRSQLALVNVLMTGKTLGVDYGKILEGMTALTFGIGVTSFQGESHAVSMVKPDSRPLFERMADFTFVIDILVRHLLRHKTGADQEKRH